MTYRDVPADEADRLKALSTPERELERVTLTEECEKLSRHEKLTNAQEERYGAALDALEWLHMLDKRDEIRASIENGTAHIESPDGYSGPISGRPRASGFRPNGDAVRDNAARTVDAAFRSGLLPDHGAEKATALLDQGLSAERGLAARWAVAAGDPHYATAFAKLCADPVRGHLLWDASEQAAWQAAAHVQGELSRGLTLSGTSAMVPLHIDPAIILTSAGSINPLRKIARVERITTTTWSGVSSAGVSAEWKTEAAQVADASPTLANPTVPTYLGDAFVPFSYEAEMDALNFLAELQKLLVDALDQLQATAFTTGSGSGQPTGIITALTGGSSIVTAATDDAFAKADVYSTQNALPARFSPNAQWCAALPIINLMSQMETTNGARLFPELSESRLLNRPINELSNMDSAVTTSGAVANYVLAYGDWSNFVIVDRIGSTLELIPNLMGANNRPTGQRGAMLWARTGSDSVNDAAFRLLNVASAA